MGVDNVGCLFLLTRPSSYKAAHFEKRNIVSRSSRQFRILIVIRSLGGGGAERVAVDLAEYWTANGMRVTIATRADESSDAYVLPDSVERVVLGLAQESRGLMEGLSLNLRRVWRLRRLIRRTRPDVVLGMMTTSSVLAVLAASGLGCRVIATEHTHPPVQSISGLWKRLRRWAYPRAARVVTLTSGTAAWVEAHLPGSKVAVIPNAVRWPLVQAEPVVEPPARDGRLRLLAVGRLHPLKGFDLLIEAFARVAQQLPEWDLVILGEGALRETLQRQIDELGLAERVSMPGRVGNVGQWYEQSDLYVLSSRAEGLSNTLLEAMASGLPCVAFDCDTGPREIIRPDIDGVLVRPSGDVQALADQLADMMAHKHKRQWYGLRAVDVLERFSPARVTRLWDEQLRD